MVFKKGSIDWSMGKLISLVLLVVVVALIIFGFTSGGINPLVEKIGGKFDEVLILLNLKDDFKGDLPGCRTLDLTNPLVRGGDEFLEAMIYLNGRSAEGYRLDLFGENDFKSLDICRGPQKSCVLNASVGGEKFSWSWDYKGGEVYANQRSTWHKKFVDKQNRPIAVPGRQHSRKTMTSFFLIPISLKEYRFNTGKNNLKDSQFYWELRNKTIGLSNELALDSFDKMYEDLEVFYGYAYGGKNSFGFIDSNLNIDRGVISDGGDILKYGDSDDELMFAVGWNGVWDIYFYPKFDGNYLYPRMLASEKGTNEMLKFFKREMDDFTFVWPFKDSDDDLHYKTMNLSEYREILSWKSDYFLYGTEDFGNRGPKAPQAIFPNNSNKISNSFSKSLKYDSDNDLDSDTDIDKLKVFIDEKNKKRSDVVGIQNIIWERGLVSTISWETIDVLGREYTVNDIVIPSDDYPLISLEGLQGEYFLKLAWPLRGEINFWIGQENGKGFVSVGDSDDYMLPRGEFLDGYMVTGIYELMNVNC